MKKSVQVWLSVMVLVLLAGLLLQNVQLQRQVARLDEQLVSSVNSLQRQISDIPPAFARELREQASLWSDCQVTSGELTEKTWTLPVTVSVTPKAVSADTSAVLELAGQQTAMTREGVHFTAHLELPLFAGGEGLIILSEGGKQRMGPVAVYPDYNQCLLLESCAFYRGEIATSKQRWSYDGTVEVNVPHTPQAAIWPVEGELILLLDGRQAKRESFRLDEQDGATMVKWQAKGEGQTVQQIELWCYVVDNQGLTYRILVDRLEAGDEGLMESRDERCNYVQQICAPDGQVLYQPQEAVR